MVNKNRRGPPGPSMIAVSKVEAVVSWKQPPRYNWNLPFHWEIAIVAASLPCPMFGLASHVCQEVLVQRLLRWQSVEVAEWRFQHYPPHVMMSSVHVGGILIRMLDSAYGM